MAIKAGDPRKRPGNIPADVGGVQVRLERITEHAKRNYYLGRLSPAFFPCAGALRPVRSRAAQIRTLTILKTGDIIAHNNATRLKPHLERFLIYGVVVAQLILTAYLPQIQSHAAYFEPYTGLIKCTKDCVRIRPGFHIKFLSFLDPEFQPQKRSGGGYFLNLNFRFSLKFL